MHSIVYADPPWSYDNKNTGGSMTSGSANKYPTMSLLEICSLAHYIRPIVCDDSVLFLWVPEPIEEYAWTVMDVWGYKRKGRITWIKRYPGNRRGMGFWFSTETEGLHFGIRGEVKPFRSMIPNYLVLPVLGHSEKPAEFRGLIERASAKTMPGVNKLELFGRKSIEGWTVLGNAVDGLDIRESLTRTQSGIVLPEPIQIKEDSLDTKLDRWFK